MAEERGTPFEDGAAAPYPAPLEPAVAASSSPRPVAGAASGSAAAQVGPTDTGPAPGSAEEAAIIFRALAEGSRAPAKPARLRPGLIAGTVLIVIATVVGLVVAADYLEHVAASNAPSTPAGSGGGVLSVSETNLKSALRVAVSYESAHDGSFEGLTAAVLARAVPSLTFTPLSTLPSEIALATPVAGALVLTSLQTSPAACMGVLQVSSSQAVPIFSGYVLTARPGTYFFAAPAPAGVCDAVTVTPPPGGAYVSTSGFPTARLP